MEFGIINVAAAPVRKKADHRSEMVNQLLFGEAVRVVKTKGKLWLKIKSLHDGYDGWLTRSLLEEADEITAGQPTPFIVADLFAAIGTGDKRLTISAGSGFHKYKEGMVALAGVNYTIDGAVENAGNPDSLSDKISAMTLPWMNVPYMWGGRTPMGIDCSGFTQVIFKQLGINLPRDAWQQAIAGMAVDNLTEAIPGDLVFFGRKDRITHVGILVGDQKIIHASGRVKIDSIEKKGVRDSVTGKLLLRIKAIRRFL